MNFSTTNLIRVLRFLKKEIHQELSIKQTIVFLIALQADCELHKPICAIDLIDTNEFCKETVNDVFNRASGLDYHNRKRYHQIFFTRETMENQGKKLFLIATPAGKEIYKIIKKMLA